MVQRKKLETVQYFHLRMNHQSELIAKQVELGSQIGRSKKPKNKLKVLIKKDHHIGAKIKPQAVEKFRAPRCHLQQAVCSRKIHQLAQVLKNQSMRALNRLQLAQRKRSKYTNVFICNK